MFNKRNLEYGKHLASFNELNNMINYCQNGLNRILDLSICADNVLKAIENHIANGGCVNESCDNNVLSDLKEKFNKLEVKNNNQSGDFYELLKKFNIGGGTISLGSLKKANQVFSKNLDAIEILESENSNFLEICRSKGDSLGLSLGFFDIDETDSDRDDFCPPTQG